ncbi:HlyD family efflux transporter periplasmic adaptor subunit [Clostridium sp. LY3-2]|uniref:efflux RND transporter periplasmic adaptor subunit n=1 Tax=Clostridium sp. LY3-2 TaxID=2942482 RepID=UPI0021521ADC|nr:HlyD family efflux transporter periplasmic adaptor subunit [Clostridium sp. LY3-2]MCR6514532.1 HlyD family efflux transporter periplasmic adaptor subunit [Clostridium sp. LY3-2]
MKKKYIGIIVCVVVIIAATIGMVLLKNSSAKKEAKIETITIPSVEKVFINGKIVPNESKKIYLDIASGEVSSVSVKNGETVKKGDVLFTYKNDKLDTQIKDLELQLKSAKEQKSDLLKKKDELDKKAKEDKEKLEKIKNESLNSGKVPEAIEGVNPMAGSISGDSIDTQAIDKQINLLENQIKNLKSSKYKEVTAPINGIVTINKDNQNVQEPYMIIQSNNLYVDGVVNEKDQQKVKKNQKVDISILANNKNIKGKIISVSDIPENSAASLDPKSSQNMSFYKVDIDLDSQKGIVDGFHVQATVNLDEKDITIPKSAVLDENGKKYVYIVSDNKLKKAFVTVTEDKDNYIVKEGLNSGEKVVKTPDSTMKEGMEA